MARSDDPDPATGTGSSPAFLLHKEGCTIEDYRLIVRIGEGSFGEVWKAERAGSLVALKILKTSLGSDEAQRELKSLETLGVLCHRYLLRTENFWSDGDRLFIEMELAEGGTLKERLKAYQAAGKRGVPEAELLKFFTEAAQALDYLHGHRPVFLHRDIKPANILLVQGCAKLGDFGLLRQVAGDNSSTKTQGGTFPYMAPESIASDVFSVYTDQFSFAVTYAELRQGELPFPGKNQYQICERILRAPPELADVFHAEERRVLLKALDKDPHQRFTSCGEFVFELNRVVPWTAAVTIPEMLLPRPTETGNTGSRTRGSQPTIGDPGTSHKKPLATMAEIELPPVEPTTSATTTAAAPNQGTVKIERKTRPTTPDSEMVPAPPTEVPVAARSASKAVVTMPELHVASVTVASGPVVSSRALLTAAAAAMLIAAVSGVWYLMSQNAKNGVRELIAEKKYPDALAAIASANPLLLLNADHLDKQVEDEWLAELREPGPAAAPESLKKMLVELDRFNTAFPNHEAALARRSRVEKRLEEALDTELDQLFAAGQLRAARDRVNQFKDVLADRGTAFLARIQEQEDATPRIQVQPRPVEVATPKAADTTQAAAALAAAWRPLLADVVVLDTCRRAVKEARDRLATQPRPVAVQEQDLQAIDTLIRAHESSADVAHKAVADLVAQLRSGAATDDLSRNIWLGLARLDRNKELLTFADLDALPASPDDAGAKKAAAELFAHVLERRLRQDGYAWVPSKAEAAKVAAWCAQRVGATRDAVNALHVECLLESGAPVPQPGRGALPENGDWYIGYARALLMDANKEHAKAADILAGIVMDNAKAIRPDHRLQHAVRVLRAAVAALPRTGVQRKQFATAADAGKATSWLTAVVALAEPPTVDDLGDLAFAAVQLDAATTLDLVEKLTAGKLPEADRSKGHDWLGNAYRLQLELAAGDIAKGRFAQAIAKSTQSERYAHVWKKYNLESAADLYGKAVETEARAVFDGAKEGEKVEARYRVFARAVGKAADGGTLDDGLLVPAVVGKLAFAWSNGYPAPYLPQTIAEGQAALQAAAALEQSRTAQRDWWSALRCTGMVRLADVSIRSLEARLKANESITDLRMELQTIRGLYEDARRTKKYTERWSGELAFKIGFLAKRLGEEDRAAREFADSLKSLRSMPEPYPAQVRREVLEAREFLEKMLP